MLLGIHLFRVREGDRSAIGGLSSTRKDVHSITRRINVTLLKYGREWKVITE